MLGDNDRESPCKLYSALKTGQRVYYKSVNHTIAIYLEKGKSPLSWPDYTAPHMMAGYWDMSGLQYEPTHAWWGLELCVLAQM